MIFLFLLLLFHKVVLLSLSPCWAIRPELWLGQPISRKVFFTFASVVLILRQGIPSLWSTCENAHLQNKANINMDYAVDLIRTKSSSNRNRNVNLVFGDSLLNRIYSNSTFVNKVKVQFTYSSV